MPLWYCFWYFYRKLQTYRQVKAGPDIQLPGSNWISNWRGAVNRELLLVRLGDKFNYQQIRSGRHTDVIWYVSFKVITAYLIRTRLPDWCQMNLIFVCVCMCLSPLSSCRVDQYGSGRYPYRYILQYPVLVRSYPLKCNMDGGSKQGSSMNIVLASIRLRGC